MFDKTPRSAVSAMSPSSPSVTDTDGRGERDALADATAGTRVPQPIPSAREAADRAWTAALANTPQEKPSDVLPREPDLRSDICPTMNKFPV